MYKKKEKLSTDVLKMLKKKKNYDTPTKFKICIQFLTEELPKFKEYQEFEKCIQLDFVSDFSPLPPPRVKILFTCSQSTFKDITTKSLSTLLPWLDVSKIIREFRYINEGAFKTPYPYGTFTVNLTDLFEAILKEANLPDAEHKIEICHTA